MALRIRRAAGVLVLAAMLPLAGCGGGDTTGDGAAATATATAGASADAADAGLGAEGGDGAGAGREGSTAAATEAARAFQQASVDQDREAACEAMTERLRRQIGADTVAECAEITDIPRSRDYPDARVTTGEAVEVEAHGAHPAGVGLRVTVHGGTAASQMVLHSALRLVPGEGGGWLVDSDGQPRRDGGHGRRGRTGRTVPPLATRPVCPG